MKPIYPIKTLFSLAFMLLLAFEVVADEFEVKSFEKDENDLATRRYERMDINDQPCALVKIKTDLNGLSFESGVGIVGDVEYKEGQYWVYLVSGERRLSIYKKDFIRLDYSIPLPLESYDVFHMVLTAKGQKIESLPVTFQITPSDAQLTVDGKKVENEQPVQLSIGEHRFLAERKNYKPIIRNIDVNSKKVFFRFKLELEKRIQLMSQIELILVKGGCFDMGSNNGGSDEKPVHKVCVDDFYISQSEVTQKQWHEVMGSNPSYFDGCDNCPVERVSWNDAQEFIKKLNQKTNGDYRLPTEAEWEFAARGGNKSRTYKYAGSNNIDDVAWYGNNSESKTHPVGQKQHNELGLYDMSGNVWEWCSDRYDSDYYGNSRKDNPKGPSTGNYHVYRGGSWFIEGSSCRVANRSRSGPDYSYYFIGFRIAR